MTLKKLTATIIGKISPRVYFTLAYIHNRKRIPNFRNPHDLSEFAISRVLNGQINRIAYLADKYAVREYVKNKGLESILVPLIGVYNNANEIDFDILPKKFALKANYGAGMNLICGNKYHLDISKAKKCVQEWIDKPQTYTYSERHYNLIPHKVVCEEFIDDGNGGFPTDYKFLCIKGKARCILVCGGRESKHAHYAHYDMDWNFIPEYDKLHRAASVISRPQNLDDMIKVAEKLAEGIDFVRVDLYSDGRKIWFGEMTLTPAGCIFHGWSDDAIKDMGKFFKS